MNAIIFFVILFSLKIDGDVAEIFGDEVQYDPSMTFQQMNLSRPLQKVNILCKVYFYTYWAFFFIQPEFQIYLWLVEIG